jgi:hypothetical protein
MTDADIKSRLCAWAAAYAGEQYARLGHVNGARILGAVHDASGNERDDEIECIVRRMEQSGRWRESRVLRCEYFCVALTESERLQRLRGIGLPMSRTSYYAYLASARAFLAGALSA